MLNHPAIAPIFRTNSIRETLRSSGPGGQHVNKTDSAVRATHLPTGLSVKVQTERSQHANKRLARALLALKLSMLAEDQASGERAERRLQHHRLQRGSPVRVFRGEDFQPLPQGDDRRALADDVVRGSLAFRPSDSQHRPASHLGSEVCADRVEHLWRFVTTAVEPAFDHFLLTRAQLHALGIRFVPPRKIIERRDDALEVRVEYFLFVGREKIQRDLALYMYNGGPGS